MSKDSKDTIECCEESPFRGIEAILKNHYGATHVLIDSDLITVYGSDVDAVYAAVCVEYAEEYGVFYEQRDEDRKKVVLRLEKKIRKVVDS